MSEKPENPAVERVARAISEHLYANTKCGPATDCAEWEDMTDYDRTIYRRAAQAAITALRSASPPASEAGDGEAVALLRRIEPHIDAIVCYASTMGEYEPNRLAVDVRNFLATTEQPTATGEDEWQG